jgi:protein-S-isoprenylcysteine O-methyltransferase Ste14
MLDNAPEVAYLLGVVAAAVVRGLCIRGQERDKGKGLERALLILGSFGMFIIPFTYLLTDWMDFADYQTHSYIAPLGGGLFVIAIWLLWRSHADLGKNWSTVAKIKKKQALVTTGVYSRIRHPMYTSHILWSIAQILLLQNWIAGPAMLVLTIPLYAVRIPKEEKILLDEFKEYREYMKKTGRLLPKF